MSHSINSTILWTSARCSSAAACKAERLGKRWLPAIVRPFSTGSRTRVCLLGNWSGIGRIDIGVHEVLVGVDIEDRTDITADEGEE